MRDLVISGAVIFGMPLAIYGLLCFLGVFFPHWAETEQGRQNRKMAERHRDEAMKLLRPLNPTAGPS